MQLTNLLKTGNKSQQGTAAAQAEPELAEPYSRGELQEAWNAFAEQRKKFQAEYQMLMQPFGLDAHVITVHLLSPVQETMLNNIRVELTAFLRERLKNTAIQVTGDLQHGEEKKVIYTNREKFEFLADKNPALKELKDRLGLDTDF